MTLPASLGVSLGLVIGKVGGSAGFAWLAIRLRLASLPSGTSFRQLVGGGIFGGIGFTMSIFGTELAFSGMAEQLVMAKMGVLLASVIAGTTGYVWMRWALR